MQPTLFAAQLCNILHVVVALPQVEGDIVLVEGLGHDILEPGTGELTNRYSKS